MLNDNAGRFVKLFHALQRRIGIGNIVIGERFVPAYHGESKEAAGRFPRTLNLNFIKKQDMRYGENLTITQAGSLNSFTHSSAASVSAILL
jgi:hypothetical protein